MKFLTEFVNNEKDFNSIMMLLVGEDIHSSKCNIHKGDDFVSISFRESRVIIWDDGDISYFWKDENTEIDGCELAGTPFQIADTFRKLGYEVSYLINEPTTII